MDQSQTRQPLSIAISLTFTVSCLSELSFLLFLLLFDDLRQYCSESTTLSDLFALSHSPIARCILCSPPPSSFTSDQNAATIQEQEGTPLHTYLNLITLQAQIAAPHSASATAVDSPSATAHTLHLPLLLYCSSSPALS